MNFGEVLAGANQRQMANGMDRPQEPMGLRPPGTPPPPVVNDIEAWLGHAAQLRAHAQMTLEEGRRRLAEVTAEINMVERMLLALDCAETSAIGSLKGEPTPANTGIGRGL